VIKNLLLQLDDIGFDRVVMAYPILSEQQDCIYQLTAYKKELITRAKNMEELWEYSLSTGSTNSTQEEEDMQTHRRCALGAISYEVL